MSVPINIYPFKTGLDTDVQPWLLPPDGFVEINNINIKHGYLQKRSGYIPFAKAAISTADRIMGIYQYVDSTNAKQTLVFDQTRGFYYNAASNSFLDLNSGSPIFTAGTSNYIWADNYQAGTTTIAANRLYFTNGVASNSGSSPTLDGIWYYSGSVGTVTAQVALLGTSGGNRYMWGAKLIFSLNDRVIVLNTFEGISSASNFPQRARWSKQSDPDTWLDDTSGNGGYEDAATGEQIISARILQNDILVFFTSSVWLLRTTYSASQPFRWERLNDFRACDGKMASCGYDRYALAMGSRGITASDGVQTRRVDDRIEDFVIDVINADAFSKVFIARSYDNRRMIALFPGKRSSENNSALVYDDESASFTTYSISLNCMGYGNKSMDYTLDDFSVTNDLDYSLNEMGEDTLQSYFFQENSDTLLGGDISGNVYILESSGEDDISSIESTFTTASWNPFKDENAQCKMAYVDFYIDTDTKTKATIDFFKDTEIYPYASQKMDFLPPLDYICDIIAATKANPCVVNAPSHGLSTGDVIYIYGVEGMNINSGEKQSNYTITVIDSNYFSLDGVDTSASSSYETGGSVYWNEFYRTKTWKRIYAGGTGFQHSLKFTSGNSSNPFRIHGMKPSFKPSGRRLVN